MNPIAKILALIRGHITRFHLGVVSPQSETYMSSVLGDYYSPIAPLYFYKGQRGKFTHRLAMTIVPDLVVEMAETSFHETSQRVANLLTRGVKEVVILDGEHQAAHTFCRNSSPMIHSRDDDLRFAQLPRLSIHLRTIFKQKKVKPQQPLTLFDARVFERLGTDYPSTLARVFDSSRLLEREWDVFQDLARFEIGDFRPTCVAGPLVFRIEGRVIDCSKPRRKSIELTGSVEPDRLQFQRLRAKGVLYVEMPYLYDNLREVEAWKKLGLILVCGFGIPRPQTLRLLHRLSTELKLPVYVLADNYTWGYFIFTVLKRGTIAPNRIKPELAVENVRYLGHCAGELKRVFDPKHWLIAWKPRYELRLRAMTKYPCFRTQAWKTEFANFRAQHGKYHAAAFAYGVIRKRHSNSRQVWSNYVDRYLLPKLQARDWLT